MLVGPDGSQPVISPTDCLKDTVDFIAGLSIETGKDPARIIENLLDRVRERIAEIQTQPAGIKIQKKMLSPMDTSAASWREEAHFRTPMTFIGSDAELDLVIAREADGVQIGHRVRTKRLNQDLFVKKNIKVKFSNSETGETIEEKIFEMHLSTETHHTERLEWEFTELGMLSDIPSNVRIGIEVEFLD